MKKRLLSVIFILIAHVGFPQIDSLNLLKDSNNDSIRAAVYLAISTYYNGKNPDSIIFYAKEVIALTKGNQGLKSLYTGAHRNIGSGMIFKRAYDSAQYYYALERALLDSLVNPLNYAVNLSNIGITHYYKGDYGNAIKYFLSSIKIRESNDLDAARVYNYAAAVYQQMGDTEKAKNHYKMAYFKAEERGELNSSLSNLAGLYIDLEVFDSALLFAQKSLLQYRKVGAKSKESHALGVIGYANMHLGNYSAALKYLDSARFVSKESGTLQRVAELFSYKAQTLIKQRKFRLAHQNLDSALAYSRNPLIRKDVAKYRSEIYNELGDKHEAFESYKGFISIRDSLDNVEKHNQIAELETKYKTEKKEQEIRNLKQSALIAEAKATQKNILWISSVLVILLLVIVGFIWFRSKVAIEKSRVLEANQRFLRSRINPHFLFNALTSIRSYLYDEKSAKLAISYISNFAVLMRKILEHSGIENVSLKEELEALASYVDLQKLRFANEFEYGVEIDPAINSEETYLPPLLLQPYVENAIEYGIGNQQNGSLKIEIIKPANKLEISITDNGKSNQEGKKRPSISGGIQKSRFKIFNSTNKSSVYSLKQSVLVDHKNKKTGYQIQISIPILQNDKSNLSR